MKRSLFCIVTFIYSSFLFAQDIQVPTPQWKPVYHFSPLKNWTNDPNGLLYLNGVYHMFNQQNPFENKWGHMSWGHSTSTDLVHWKHLPIAMPETIDKDTTWRFSGSAVWDKYNSSGFCKPGGCMVAIYTADQPDLKKESQFVAYSNNGGMQFINYAGNPVIDLHKKDFRDPNVSWNDQLKKWLMVVALPGENKVQFYSSANLKNWKLLSEFGPAGLKGGIWECPFFLQLPVEGTDEKKWILVNSFGGAENPMMQYFIGNFDGTTFTNDNPSDKVLIVDDGDCFYAAIPWNNLPGNRKTFIGWMVPPAQETYPWRGQMSIPRDITLRHTEMGIRLFQEPAAVIKKELSTLSSGHFIRLKNLQLDSTATNLVKGRQLHGNSYWLEAELKVPSTTIAGFRIGEERDRNNNLISETDIGYDAVKHQVFVDRTHSGKGKINADNERETMDVTVPDGTIKLEILFDKSSLEVFANNGEKVLTTYIYPGKNADLFSAFSWGGKAVIQSETIWDLSAIKQ